MKRRSTSAVSGILVALGALGCSGADPQAAKDGYGAAAVPSATAPASGTRAAAPAAVGSGTVVRGDSAAPSSPASGSAMPTASAGPAASAAAGAMAPATTATAVEDMRPNEVAEFANDWPLPNFDYQSTRATFHSKIDATTVQGLHELWRAQLPQPTSQGTFSGTLTSNPLIAGDVVVLQDMGSNVFAVERASGAMRWAHRYDLPTNGPNGVAIGYGKVYANHGDVGLVALDLQSGEERWRYEPTLARGEGIDIQPLVYGGYVFVSTVPMSMRAAYVAGTHGIFMALDAETGEVVWQFDTLDSDEPPGSPVLDSGGGAWYPPSIDAARGRLYWGTGNPVPFPAGRRQLRPGDKLYTSGVLTLQLTGGDPVWFHQEAQFDLFDWDFQNPPILVQGGVGGQDVVVGSGKTGTVVALSAETGMLQWRTKVGMHMNDSLTELSGGNMSVAPGVLGGVLTPPAYAEGVVYVPVVNNPSSYGSGGYSASLSGTGELVALDVETGAVLWSQPLKQSAYGAATVINDLVFTSDSGGTLYVFGRKDGKMMYQYSAPGGVNAPLAVAGDMLLIASGSGGQSVLVALSL